MAANVHSAITFTKPRNAKRCIPICSWRMPKTGSISCPLLLLASLASLVAIRRDVGAVCLVGRYPQATPAAQERFLTPSARRDTHRFGGLGFTREPNSRPVDLLISPEHLSRPIVARAMCESHRRGTV